MASAPAFSRDAGSAGPSVVFAPIRKERHRARHSSREIPRLRERQALLRGCRYSAAVAIFFSFAGTTSFTAPSQPLAVMSNRLPSVSRYLIS